MCGRFTLRTPTAKLVEQFSLGQLPEQLALRYNIAPTQDVAVVRLRKDSSERKLQMMRWGLIPSWAKEPSSGAPLINARSESVADKPSFRTAFRRRRCLIPADGYFEWIKEGKRKKPYYIRRDDQSLFAFAGLWEYWRGGDEPGGGRFSCTIVTTVSNAATREIHERMPAMLEPDEYEPWLNEPDLDAVARLLRPYEGPMRVDPVNPRVNNARNDDPGCVEVARELF